MSVVALQSPEQQQERQAQAPVRVRADVAYAQKFWSVCSMVARGYQSPVLALRKFGGAAVRGQYTHQPRVGHLQHPTTNATNRPPQRAPADHAIAPGVVRQV